MQGRIANKGKRQRKFNCFCLKFIFFEMAEYHLTIFLPTTLRVFMVAGNLAAIFDNTFGRWRQETGKTYRNDLSNQLVMAANGKGELL